MRSARLLFALLASSALSPEARASDPTGPGPFRAGFTSEVVVDPTRPGTSPFGNRRPVAIAVFYPVDPADVRSTTPTARYPRNPVFVPIHLPGNEKHVLPSTAFERYGIDPAYHEPAASKAGPFPLVVLGPGGQASWALNVWIGARLATHGFVVAIVSHHGDGAYPSFPEPRAPPSIVDPFQQPTAARMPDRPRDFSFAIDRLIARSATPGDLLHGVVDPTRIGAAGHSLGGYAALVLAGGDDDVCDTFAAVPRPTWCPDPGTGEGGESASFPDSRVKALLLLDASSQMLHWYELSRVTIPTLVVGQSWNTLIESTGPAARILNARAHAAVNGEPNYRVDVIGTRHIQLTNACEHVFVRRDLGILTAAQVESEVARIQCCVGACCLERCEGSPLPYPAAHDVVARYAVAFLKTELAREPGYERVLTPGWALTREPDAQLFVTEPRTGIDPAEDFPYDEAWYFTTQPGDVERGPKDPPGLSTIEEQTFSPEEPAP